MTDDKDLDLLFATARENRPAPSGDLMARVLADAYEVQPVAAPESRPAAQRQGGLKALFETMSQAFGGKGALAGLGTAALAGVWLGYSGPSGLDWLTNALAFGTSDVEMIAADDLFLSEG